MSRPASVDAIIAKVALEHGVSAAELLSDTRWQKVAHARQHAFAAVRGMPRKPSYPQIGRWFGRDHSTVVHGVRAHEARRSA